MEVIQNLPPITKVYLGLCVALVSAVYLDLVTVYSLYLNWNLVLFHHQYWRLLTNLLFFDFFGLNFIIRLYFSIRYSEQLEGFSFRGSAKEYLVMWLFAAGGLTFFHAIVTYTNLFIRIPFIAPHLSFFIVIIWTKFNPDILLSILGLVTLRAPYFPYVLMILPLLYGDYEGFFIDFAVIFLAHLYFFLHDVYPLYSGRYLLSTRR